MKNKFPVLKPHLLLMGMVITTCTFAQQPGDLDLNFGTDGISTFGETLRHDQARSLALRPDGKIVITGKVSSSSGQDNDIIVAQLLQNGLLDSDFGVNGVTVTDLGGTSDIGQDVVMGTGNKILVAAGSNQSGEFQAALIQYDTNGAIDASFGNSGSVFIDLGDNGSGIVSTSPMNAGYFFGIGYANGDIAIAKFQQSGVLENTFGDSGIELIDLGASSDAGGRVVVQEDGLVLFTARKTEIGEFANGVVGRLNPDGTLDLTFNGTGWLNLDLSNNIDIVVDFALLPNGEVLTAGTVFDEVTLESEIFVLRLLPNGTYDTAFGINGISKYDIGLGNDNAAKIVLQPDGKAIIGGSANDGNDDNFCLIRINEDGSLDPTFGDGGVVITEISTGYDGIASMALQPDGKLVVAGTARIGTNDDIALARYHTGLNLSVNDRDEKPLFSVYPNPATETLNVRSEAKLQTIELIDALGKKVLTVRPNSNGSQLDIAMLPSGIYLLRATDGQRLYTQKVVKE